MPPRTSFDLKKYLHNYDKKTKYGVCLKCDQKVEWRIKRLISHKKIKCEDAEFQEVLRVYQESEKDTKRVKELEGKLEV